VSSDTRYSKEQLLDIYQNHRDSGGLTSKLEDIFQASWDPVSDHNGSSAGGGDGKDQYPGPDVCWNYSSDEVPFGLTSMTEEEKQVCSIYMKIQIHS
jgi:PERQ amino acid-rich with GYF domain-containing protein